MSLPENVKNPLESDQSTWECEESLLESVRNLYLRMMILLEKDESLLGSA